MNRIKTSEWKKVTETMTSNSEQIGHACVKYKQDAKKNHSVPHTAQKEQLC